MQQDSLCVSYLLQIMIVGRAELVFKVKLFSRITMDGKITK